MMAKREFVACSSGDVVIRHGAHSGCSRCDSDRMTPEEAMHHLAYRAGRYRELGYPVTVLAGTAEYPTQIEVEERPDGVMVGDLEGTFSIVQVMVPAGRCWQCDDLVPIGEECPCYQFNEDAGLGE